jgi:hypothetical protein
LGRTLEGAGFIGRAPRWRLSGPDAVVMVEVSKSQYDLQHYVDVGIWLKAIDGTEPSAPFQCHVNMRIESLFPERYELILTECLLSADEEAAPLFSDDFQRFLTLEFLPTLKELTRVDRLRAFMRAGRFSNALVFKEAKELLS